MEEFFFFFSFLELHLEGLEFLPGSIFSYPQLFFLDLCLLSARISVLMRLILKTCLQKLRERERLEVENPKPPLQSNRGFNKNNANSNNIPAKMKETNEHI